MAKQTKRPQAPTEKPRQENDSARNNPPLGIEAADAARPKDSAQEQRGPAAAGGKVKPPAPPEHAPMNALIITCPYCGQRCASNKSSPLFTRYYCPTTGCSYSQKVPKKEIAERINRQRRRDDNDKGFSARP
jgi:hypothetical protein